MRGPVLFTLALQRLQAEMYTAGEELFALKITTHPELVKIKKEACLLDQLYGLYMDVLQTLERLVAWVVFSSNRSRPELSTFFSIRTYPPNPGASRSHRLNLAVYSGSPRTGKTASDGYYFNFWSAQHMEFSARTAALLLRILSLLSYVSTMTSGQFKRPSDSPDPIG